ncbi:uncharacterized protein [Epargyreus clarus]|uniref:uncharacterized protein n=1 Tax=Epargyreus clarus TaxID=520877 RepID=UPI003C2C306C
MCIFESRDDDYNPICGLVKTILFIVIATFVLIMPMTDPHCDRIDNTENKNTVLCYACEACSLIAKAANKVIETVKCIMCELFEITCETKVEEKPSLKLSNVKKCASDVPSKTKNKLPMMKLKIPKKDKKASASKSNSCAKCVDKGVVCPEICSKTKKK